MIRQIIKSNPKFKRLTTGSKSEILNISECFADTVQGEGINTGCPATFMRFQFCTLNCVWCDSKEVWRFGNKYLINEVLDLFEENGLIERFKEGQHLIFTGGSPLKQQENLYKLIERFKERFGFLPHIEIENECTLLPTPNIVGVIDTWNNSPKLENSGMKKELRYKPDVLRILSCFKNSWFKFVVTSYKDWQEIEEDFLNPGLIKKEQVILMPEGIQRLQLQDKYDFVVKLANKKGVRMTDRLQVTIWDMVTGV